MMRLRMGEITLGIKDEAYEGLWKANLDAKTITYIFAKELPDGNNNITVTYNERWKALLPYEYAGKLINEYIK